MRPSQVRVFSTPLDESKSKASAALAKLDMLSIQINTAKKIFIAKTSSQEFYHAPKNFSYALRNFCDKICAEVGSMKNLIIIGVGGFAREIYWHAQKAHGFGDEWRIKGFLDDKACGGGV